MNTCINPPPSDFEVLRTSPFYRDKTGLLELTDSVVSTPLRYICICCPDGFGKTGIVSMLSAYYGRGQDTSSLFEGLEISGSPGFRRHLNQYDVIRLNVRDAFSSYRFSGCGTEFSFSLFLQNLVIRDLIQAFPETVTDRDLIPASPTSWFNPYACGLDCVLERLADQRYGRFVFLMDDWDVLFRDEQVSEEEQRDFIFLLRMLFKGKSTARCYSLVYMTGLFPVKKYGTQTTLPFTEHSMAVTGLLQYTPFIGFSDADVQDLCSAAGMDPGEMKIWYGGYCQDGSSCLYRPASVTAALAEGRCRRFLDGAEFPPAAVRCLELDDPGLEQALFSLLYGRELSVNTDAFQNEIRSATSRDAVLTLLAHLGCLSCRHLPESGRDTVSIPNWELMLEFRRILSQSPKWKPAADALGLSEEALDALQNRDAGHLASVLEAICRKCMKYIDFSADAALSVLIAVAFSAARREYSLRFDETGRHSRTDALLLPFPGSRRPAVLVEAVRRGSAKSAVRRLRARNRTGGTDPLLLAGIRFISGGSFSCSVEYRSSAGL